MKRNLLRICPLFALLLAASCKKTINGYGNPTNALYSKWAVSTIKINSVLIPKGIVWDTVYKAKATDYVDLSKKGTIDFYINQQHTVETYDTTKFNLLKDTTVNVGTGIGFNSVSLLSLNASNASLKSSKFGVDAGTETIFSLVK